MSLKIILVGDKNVGKSCLIYQYTIKEFSPEYKSTTSNDRSEVEIKVNDLIIRATIWDTIGQERYISVNTLFMKNTKIALLVYDITNRQTFANLENWNERLKNNCDCKVIGIIANKSDLYEDQVVSKEEGENFAKSINGLFFETSAMDYESVSNAFQQLVEKYVNDGYEDIKIYEEKKNNEEKKNIENLVIQKDDISKKQSKRKFC